MSLSGGQLAGGNSASEKAENDYYATDPETVKMFLKRFYDDGNIIEGSVWEPAAGGGNISEVVKAMCPRARVVSTDIVQRNYKLDSILNFIEGSGKDIEKVADTVITNPPFSLINDFIEHGLKSSKKYLILFAKIQTLEGVARKKLLEDSPLRYVYVHSTRQATWKNGESLDPNGKKWATTMFLAWFVWEHGYKGEPVIRWL